MDTVVWFPRHVRLPVPSFRNAATAAAQALTHALLHPTPTSPLFAICDNQHDALQQLADIFADVSAPTTMTPAQPQPVWFPLSHTSRTYHLQG